ncbi:MAG: DMT family transporter [Pseudomonadota bacterium]
MQEYFLFILFGVMVGISIAAQSGVNAMLKTILSSPIQAAFISFLIGTIVLGIITITQGYKWFGSSDISKLPWWAWLGGALGAFNISMSVFLAPRLGALLLCVSIVFGQMIASLLFDNLGIVGYPKIEITLTRFIGAFLIAGGLYLVANK